MVETSFESRPGSTQTKRQKTGTRFQLHSHRCKYLNPYHRSIFFSILLFSGSFGPSVSSVKCQHRQSSNTPRPNGAPIISPVFEEGYFSLCAGLVSWRKALNRAALCREKFLPSFRSEDAIQVERGCLTRGEGDIRESLDHTHHITQILIQTWDFITS